MPSPLERLQKIIAAWTPTQVIYVPDSMSDKDTFYLKMVKTQEGFETLIAEDAELQRALKPHLTEQLNRTSGIYTVESDPERLWSYIRHKVVDAYLNGSPRCDATKRKTEKFINNITLKDVHLANYVICFFLKSKTQIEQADCEAFETLRRSYGKRSK